MAKTKWKKFLEIMDGTSFQERIAQNEKEIEEERKTKLTKGFSKQEIFNQIERGDNESLGWKDKHYLGAISKMMWNNKLDALKNKNE